MREHYWLQSATLSALAMAQALFADDAVGVPGVRVVSNENGLSVNNEIEVPK